MTDQPARLKPVSLTITQELIGRYCELTEDMNPIHTDPAFAALTPLGSVIAPGTLSLNLIWEALHLTLGADALKRATLDIRFVAPARPGDVITAGGEALTQGSGYNVWTRNQDGQATILGEFTSTTRA